MGQSINKSARYWKLKGASPRPITRPFSATRPTQLPALFVSREAPVRRRDTRLTIRPLLEQNGMQVVGVSRGTPVGTDPHEKEVPAKVSCPVGTQRGRT
jgi:hypothetical protein